MMGSGQFLSHKFYQTYHMLDHLCIYTVLKEVTYTKSVRISNKVSNESLEQNSLFSHMP